MNCSAYSKWTTLMIRLPFGSVTGTRTPDGAAKLLRTLRIIMLSSMSLLGLISPSTEGAEPPYSGTVFISPDVIRPSDATSFVGARYNGRGMRMVFDRRVNDWVTIDAYLYNLTFSQGKVIEAIVNPEFDSYLVRKQQILRFARMVGRLPAYLRTSVDALWIHKGDQPWGGGNRSLLIHTDTSVDPGYFEETMFHEAAHTSVDANVYGTPGWNGAVQADPGYISLYARDNSDREDVAESLLSWFMVRERADRISTNDQQKILMTIPNRLTYYDNFIR